MVKIQLPIMDSATKEKILNALITYFVDNNYKLGGLNAIYKLSRSYRKY